MAIWQHSWTIVPLTPDFGHRYTVFNNQESTAYLKESDIFWAGSDIDISALISKIDHILPRAYYTSTDNPCWKSGGTNAEDNDCQIFINEGEIMSMRFRIDVRYPVNISKCLHFLIDLCTEFGLTLINTKYQHIQPQLQDLVNDVTQSSAAAFLKDPHAFLDSLD